VFLKIHYQQRCLLFVDGDCHGFLSPRSFLSLWEGLSAIVTDCVSSTKESLGDGVSPPDQLLSLKAVAGVYSRKIGYRECRRDYVPSAHY
jgi:hypothetical protein